MKLFATMPDEFTRKGITYVKTKMSKETAIKRGFRYRLVCIFDSKLVGTTMRNGELYTPKILVYVEAE